jgi:DNA-binding XRE family transcriptional regulator
MGKPRNALQLAPTDATPGSEEKIRIIQQRIAAKLPCKLPGDVTDDPRQTLHIRRDATGHVISRTSQKSPGLAEAPPRLFKDVIRTLRIRAGLSQAQLAKLAGVSKDSISKYERGEVKPYRSPLARLSAALGAPVRLGDLVIST